MTRYLIAGVVAAGASCAEAPCPTVQHLEVRHEPSDALALDPQLAGRGTPVLRVTTSTSAATQSGPRDVVDQRPFVGCWPTTTEESTTWCLEQHESADVPTRSSFVDCPRLPGCTKAAVDIVFELVDVEGVPLDEVLYPPIQDRVTTYELSPRDSDYRTELWSDLVVEGWLSHF